MTCGGATAGDVRNAGSLLPPATRRNRGLAGLALFFESQREIPELNLKLDAGGEEEAVHEGAPTGNVDFIVAQIAVAVWAEQPLLGISDALETLDATVLQMQPACEPAVTVRRVEA